MQQVQFVTVTDVLSDLFLFFFFEIVDLYTAYITTNMVNSIKKGCRLNNANTKLRNKASKK